MKKSFLLAILFLLQLWLYPQNSILKKIHVSNSVGVQYRLPLILYFDIADNTGNSIFDYPEVSFAGTRLILNASLNDKTYQNEIEINTLVGYRFINYYTPFHDTTRQLWLINPGYKKISLDLELYYSHKFILNESGRVSIAAGITFHNVGNKSYTFIDTSTVPNVQKYMIKPAKQTISSLYFGIGYSWYNRLSLQIGTYYLNSFISDINRLVIFNLPHIDIKYTFPLRKDKEPEPGIKPEGL